MLPSGRPAVRRRAAARQLAAFIAAALLCLPGIARAQDQPPANNLQELGRELSGCLSRTALVATGSRVTITFMMKRDGSAFGKPRITYAHLEGDEEAQKRFLGDVEHAVDSCLPLKVTPALGGAIAGRMFSVTLGRPKPERAI
jgi:hypothetical protein